MSAQPVARAAAPGNHQPPGLAVIQDCPRCRQRVVVARDRGGQPRMLLIGDDRRAMRDPDGELWAAVLNGRWCVVTVGPGEDPPTSGGGARFTEHRCPQVMEPPAGRRRPAGGGPEPAGRTVRLYEFEVGVVRRPAGRGEGVSGPACPECGMQDQFPPGGGAPYSRLCIRCGRVTCRSDGDLVPWCGGGLVRYDVH